MARIFAILILILSFQLNANCTKALFFAKYAAEKAMELPFYTRSQARTVINGSKILKMVESSQRKYIKLSQIGKYHPIPEGSAAGKKASQRYMKLRDYPIQQKKNLSIQELQRLMPSVTNIKVIQIAPNEFIPFDGGGRVLVLRNLYRGRNIDVEVEVLHFAQENQELVLKLIKEVQLTKPTKSMLIKPAKIGGYSLATLIAGGSIAAYFFYRHGYYGYYQSIYADDVDAEVIAYDQIIHIDQPIPINVEVRRINLHTGAFIQSQADVIIKKDDVVIFQGKTDDLGILSLELPHQLPEGNHRFTVEASKMNFKMERNHFTVKVVKKDRPFAIVDIDKTLSTDSGLPFVMGPNADNKRISGSLEMVRDLEKTHEIVYLTHRSNLFLAKTNRWLEQESYPSAPVIYSDYLDPQSNDFVLYQNSAEYKIEVLKELQEKFPGNQIEYGIGDKLKDATAYNAVGISNILILDDDEEKLEEQFPTTTQFLNSWTEFKK